MIVRVFVIRFVNWINCDILWCIVLGLLSSYINLHHYFDKNVLNLPSEIWHEVQELLCCTEKAEKAKSCEVRENNRCDIIISGLFWGFRGTYTSCGCASTSTSCNSSRDEGFISKMLIILIKRNVCNEVREWMRMVDERKKDELRLKVHSRMRIN
jgi:hypothetical protein